MENSNAQNINDFEQKLQKERIAVLHRNNANGLYASLYISIMFSAVFWHVTSPFIVSSWALYMLVLTFFRHRMARHPDNAIVTQDNAAKIFYKVTIYSWLAAAGWGLTSIIFYTPDSFEHQLLLIVCLTGLCVGVIPINAAVIKVAIVFMALVFVPLTATIIFYSEDLLNLKLLTMGIVLSMLIRQNKSFYEETTESLVAQLQIKELLFQGQIEKRKSEELNHVLSAEMAEHRQTMKKNEDLIQAIEVSIDAIYITDSKGIITYANAALCEMTGWSRETIIGIKPEVMQSPSMLDITIQDMYQQLVKGKSWNGRLIHSHKASPDSATNSGQNSENGKDYWCQASITPIKEGDGQITGYVAALRDITKDVIHEKKLERNAQISGLKSTISDILNRADSLENRLNQTLSAVTFLEAMKIQNKGAIFLKNTDNGGLELFAKKGEIHPQMTSKTMSLTEQLPLCAMAEQSGTMVQSDQCSSQICSTDNHGHYIIPMRHEDKVLGIILLYTAENPSQEACYIDLLKQISDQVMLAISSHRIHRNLEKAHKKAVEVALTKSEFLANMSHEIRTPMNGVLGMTELLLKTTLTDNQHHLAKTIHRSADSLLHILNDILDFSKIEAGKLELHNSTFDLREIIENLGDLFAESAHRKSVELICTYPVGSPFIFYADKERIIQVLTNLMGNALKFTSEGEVILSSKIVEETDSSALVYFEVKDSGIGIPENIQRKIFDSFSQADGSTTRNFGGTGLGLSISKQLITLMEGDIGVESTAGEGSTFWFNLNLKKEPLENLPEYSDFNFAQLFGKKVLIVDDHDINQDMMKRLLDSWGINSTVAVDGKQALQFLENVEKDSQQNFDLIITDYQMPNMDGLQLAKQIQEQYLLPPPMMLLSSIGIIDVPGKLETLGIVQSMHKPIRQKDLFRGMLKALSMSFSTQPSSEQKNSHSQFNHTRVLLAEDNPVNQELANIVLSELGCEITLVENGQQAVDEIYTNSDQFDLVLMDCQMPIMDGFTATKKIRDSHNDIVIIALTANAMEGDRERCLDSGMNDYLAKPFSQIQLQELLEKWVIQATEVEMTE